MSDKENMQNSELKIIAGPDSIDEYNMEEIYQISELELNGRKAIYGTRTVGLKSRTGFDPNNSPEKFMGYDFDVIMRNFNVFGLGGTIEDMKPLPSFRMAKQIYEDTGLLCSSEIMLPAIQLGCLSKEFKFKPFMVWNPAVDQLGWHIRQMAGFADEYDWIVGLKNGKWLGEDYDTAEDENYKGETSMEKAWSGLVSYASPSPETILIQRGADLPNKGEYRNLPVHQTAKRVKQKHHDQNLKLFFDPSHALGPKMRDQIVDQTVEAMKLKVSEQKYLYDGILIEVGTAKCDTYQHITVEELKQLTERLGEFRQIVGR
jgi:3-deoxy-D-arabino-heptulosonate 7-phosphate (DAHP) synthase